MTVLKEGKDMILKSEKNYILSTNNTSYVLGVNNEGVLEHMHYGGLVSPTKTEEDDTFRCMQEKTSHMKGNTICYTKDSLFQPEDQMMEISSLGKGDYRDPFIVLEYADGSQTSDFVFKDAKALDMPVYTKNLPCAVSEKAGDMQQLMVTLREKNKNVELDLYYSIFPECDVITRRAVLRNESEEQVKIKRIMSLQLDLDDDDYKLSTFGGAWAREMHKTDTLIKHGRLVNDTLTGVSSNRNNPFVMLTKVETNEYSGEGYGFNLIYSGNHYESAGVNAFFKTRFLTGINPEGFTWILDAGDAFETPEAVMTFSDAGYRGISLNMQHFVKKHIVRGNYKYKTRPILLNSWEAAYFDISESKLLNLAKKGKDAGIELFVMDDGWFKGRNDDTSSLGDWVVDEKKLPKGVEHLAKEIHKLGLDFGIWVEPEMVNENSDLYKAHPEYAMTIPGRENSLGRNQMILDLTNPEVVEYVKNAMRDVFKTPGVNYVKWDMNRTVSDVYSKVLDKDHQGETMHRYYLGLYDIMKTLTQEFPDILFEGCSSGGNRFDLGILSYFPQIWASDDTDAHERTIIQTGYSYGYPMSTVSAHVSACPNHQTLRNSPIETRYNIASFGVLGYELNLCELSGEEFNKVKAQIASYKEWRELFFGGDFYRVNDKQWMTVSKDKKHAITVIWNDLCQPNDFYKKIRTVGLEDTYDYHVYNVALKHNIKQFGGLLNMVAPIHIKQDSLVHNTIARFYKMNGEVEDYIASGKTLNNAGIKLTQAFGGTGYNDETRLFQDFASRMYFIETI